MLTLLDKKLFTKFHIFDYCFNQSFIIHKNAPLSSNRFLLFDLYTLRGACHCLHCKMNFRYSYILCKIYRVGIGWISKNDLLNYLIFTFSE